MNEAELLKDIKQTCLNLLTRRDYSQLELLNKLLGKGFTSAESQSVIDDLAEQGWQSDLRFAESFAKYRIKKGYGPLKVSYELKQRGIESFDLTPVIFELMEDWDTSLQLVYERKYTDDKVLSNKEWSKRNRFLQQRGFTGELISRLFKRLKIQISYG